MKHNGQNIITDKDITMTGEGFQGEELSGVLTNHADRINTLESNVKWIYKNGGVGSGSGHGGDSTKWSVIILRSDTNQPISEKNTVFFPREGTYPIKVQIYGGGQSSFRITFSWVNSKGSTSRPVTISADDAFTTTQQMYLDTNGSFSITVLNTNTQETVLYTINYIVTSYKFNIYYVYADTLERYRLSESNHNIFMGDVKSRGLKAALEYSIAVEVTEASYSFKNWNSKGTINSSSYGEDMQIKGKSTGIIYLPLVSDESGDDESLPGDIIAYLNNNDNANFKQFSLDLSIQLEGNIDKENIPTLYLRDNLIPSSLYLKVFTDAGGLFDSTQRTGMDQDTGEMQYSYTEDVMFSLGTSVFQLTPYFNSLQPTRIFPLTIKYDDVQIDTYQLRDQRTQYVSIPMTQSGEHTITFRITSGLDVYERTYWFYVKESTVSFNWYPDNKPPIYSSYYRNLVGIKDFELTEKDKVIRRSKNSSNLTYSFLNNNISNVNLYDQLVCIGFQYSSINDANTPLCSFNCGSNSNSMGSLVVYQDKVILMTSGITKDIYLPRTDSLDDANKNEYHLLSIYKRFEKHEGDNYWRGIYIYIDGILEAAFNDYTTLNMMVKGITLYNCNSLINLIELSYFQHDSNSSDSNNTFLGDNDILGYFYTYKGKILNILNLSQKELNLFNLFGSMELDQENFVKVVDGGYNTINSISENSEVPVLLLSYSDLKGSLVEGGSIKWDHDNFKDWITNTYQQEDKIISLPITLSWSPGGVGLQSININDTAAASFKITLQGSSTLGYRCKNFELIAPGHNDSTKTYIYSPNYDPGDTSTFLPEKSFTLKADVVDSSHTNNNAIGNFVNKITTPFSGAKVAQTGSPYEGYIKNCLTGFPILLFLSSNYKSSESVTGTNIHDYYFLGIYNFNLGRQSYYNLGYKDTNNLPILSSGFNLYEISTYEDNLLSGIEVAEIQNNGPYFDFSQYDESILFQRNERDVDYMFGDMVSGTGENDWKRNLISLLTKTSFAGGYVFDRIGKEYSYNLEDRYGYNDTYSAVDGSGVPKDQVPNYRYQRYRSTIGEDGFHEQSRSAEVGDLLDLVKGDIAEPPAYGPSLDYVSLSEYYTICMAFGLVDSVQKNLNIKTWNGNTSRPLWYLAFYDMDTCLGVSNSGAKISYFAFSDYWQADTVGSALKAAKVYRDFSPPQSQASGIGFFDTPSSYIFAVAKYANTVYRDDELFQYHPANLWAMWRQSSTSQGNSKFGCLSSSSFFMNEYFIHHLENVPLSAFNFNYKYKYFVKNPDNIGFDTTNFPKFYGRRLNNTKDWLSGRLHILDAYFNINRLEDIIHTQGGLQILAPAPDSIFVDTTNPDILVLRDIFSTTSEGQQYAGISSNVNITAEPYSPLIIVNPRVHTARGRYIFPKQKVECTIDVLTSGNQYSLFGGSYLWETLSSINPFITSSQSFHVDSKYLSQLIGTLGTCGSWTINVPSIETIKLTSGGYSGSLSFEKVGTEIPYPNLNEIDISGTSINLEIDTANITKLRATNMKAGSSIFIINVNSLSSSGVSLSGKMESLVIPAWSDNITLSSTFKCKSISISSTKPNSRLTINGNTDLTDLTIEGISKLTISGCTNLKEIKINDNTALTEISINGSDINTFTIGSTENIVDLSNQTALTSVYFKSTSMTTVKFPDHRVELKSQAFYDCRKLTYIDGGTNSTYYELTGTETFYNCPKFTLKQSNGNWCRIRPSANLTSLYRTFMIAEGVSGSSIDLEAASYFLNTLCNGVGGNVESVSYLFYNQVIHYTLDDMLEEYNNEESSLNFSNFPNCTNFSYAFYDNLVYAYNRYMFRGVTTTEGITISYMLGRNKTYSWEPTDGSNRIVYATTDFLYEIIDKLAGFAGIEYDYSPMRFSFVDPNNEGVFLPTLELKDVFNPISDDVRKYPIKLRSLHSIEVDIRHTIDFRDTFNTHWSAAVQYGLKISGFFYKRLQYPHVVSGSLERLFKDIPLIDASEVLSGVDSYPDEVNMGDFLNWENLNLCTNLFVNTSTTLESHFSSISFKKIITKEDFLSVWKKILKNFKPSTTTTDYYTKGLGYLFSNCRIVDWDGEEFFLVDPNDEERDQLINTNIRSIPLLFSNCRIYGSSSDTTPKFVSLTSDFLKYLPRLEDVFYSFYGMYWKHTIPFDFFQKRQAKQPKTGLWVQPEGTTQIEDRIPATLYEFEYLSDIRDAESCFSSIHLEVAVGFDPTDSYNCGKLDPDHLTRLVGEDGQEYQIYYSSEDTIFSNPITIPPEETDFLGIEGTYSSEVSVPNGVTGGNQPLRNIQLTGLNHTTVNFLFVSPDVLYGCKANCNITSIFAAGSSQGSWENYDTTPMSFAFTGIIPENLLLKLKSKAITNTLQNLNIIPRKFAQTIENGITQNHYLYVPRNFTDETSLSSSFNFKLILPNTNEHFYIFLEDSIPIGVSTLNSSLPTSANNNTRFFSLNPKYHPYNSHNNIQYHIMGIVHYDSNGDITDIDTGIDLSKFKSLHLDYLVSPALAAFVSGNIFLNLLPWDKNKYLTVKSGDEIVSYAIRFGYAVDSGLSYCCKLTLPSMDDHFILGMASTGDNKIHRDCIENINDIDMDSYTENKITFIP